MVARPIIIGTSIKGPITAATAIANSKLLLDAVIARKKSRHIGDSQ
jgi:hypothetical protein